MQGALGGQTEGTHSSRTKLPKDIPPQLMPPMRLPARLSLRVRLTLSRFWLFVEMGRGPALTNESWRERPKEASRVGPVAISKSSMSLQPSKARSKAAEAARSLAIRSLDEERKSWEVGLVVVVVVVVEIGLEAAAVIEIRPCRSGGVAGWGDGD
jgi:hypothetical protein